MVTHDPVAAGHSDEVVFLADGRVVDRMAAPTAGRVLDAMKALGLTCCATASAAARGQGRLLLTAVAIVLGVGVVAGTFVLTDTARSAADAAFADPDPRVDVVVRAAPRGEGEVFSDITGELFADPMPASAVDEAAASTGSRPPSA